MSSEYKFSLQADTIENLKLFSKLLDKDISQLLEEALDEYFVSAQKRLMQKSISDDSAMTNLDYDEFWEGVDI
jgi:hypothetical protein